MSARVLLLDVETAPKRAYVWGIWDQNIAPKQLISDWFILTWAAKWLDKPRVYGQSIHKTDAYAADDEDDSELMLGLHDMLDAADIVVAHNGKRFDIPIINTRFLKHEMKPPSPYKQVDTLLEARRNFKITSNRLDFIGRFLELGHKIDTGGFDLWARCMRGEKGAFDEMLKYNKQDVLLLEAVYLRLRPYMKNHPNLTPYHDPPRVSDNLPSCIACGSKNLQKRGKSRTTVSTFIRYQCQDCGKWMRGGKNQRDRDEMDGTMRDAK